MFYGSFLEQIMVWYIYCNLENLKSDSELSVQDHYSVRSLNLFAFLCISITFKGLLRDFVLGINQNFYIMLEDGRFTEYTFKWTTHNLTGQTDKILIFDFF